MCAVPYIPYDQIEWIWTFVKGPYHLRLYPDPVMKAPMAAAKIDIHYQSLSSYFAPYVRRVYYVPQRFRQITCSNGRLVYICEYHIAQIATAT